MNSTGSGVVTTFPVDSNPRLAKQRAPFFEYMDGNPLEKEMFIRAALAEGGIRGLQTNFEQMMNYGNARKFTNTHEIIHSGFFGPVNRGDAQKHIVSPEEGSLALIALRKVRLGSNILDYRTDQGMKGDPNYTLEHNALYRPINLNGNFFADHPMFGAGPKSWAARQKAADIAFLQEQNPQAIVEATPKEAAMDPQVSVPISSTNLVVSQLGQKLINWLQMLGASVATTFVQDAYSFKGTPFWVAAMGVAGLEIYKHYWLKGSNEATIELANSLEKKFKEQETQATN